MVIEPNKDGEGKRHCLGRYPKRKRPWVRKDRQRGQPTGWGRSDRQAARARPPANEAHRARSGAQEGDTLGTQVGKGRRPGSQQESVSCGQHPSGSRQSRVWPRTGLIKPGGLRRGAGCRRRAGSRAREPGRRGLHQVPKYWEGRGGHGASPAPPDPAGSGAIWVSRSRTRFPHEEVPEQPGPRGLPAHPKTEPGARFPRGADPRGCARRGPRYLGDRPIAAVGAPRKGPPRRSPEPGARSAAGRCKLGGTRPRGPPGPTPAGETWQRRGRQPGRDVSAKRPIRARGGDRASQSERRAALSFAYPAAPAPLANRKRSWLGGQPMRSRGGRARGHPTRCEAVRAEPSGSRGRWSRRSRAGRKIRSGDGIWSRRPQVSPA